MAYITATYIALALAAIGTGVQVYSANKQADAAVDAAEYNNRNAQTEAHNTELEAAEQAKRMRDQNRRALGAIRAKLASGGTLTTEGTPLTILGESSANLDLGIQDAVRKANMQAASYRSQGLMGLYEGQQSAASSQLGAVGSAFSGLASYGNSLTRTKTVA